MHTLFCRFGIIPIYCFNVQKSIVTLIFFWRANLARYFVSVPQIETADL
ncbi:hypothetical protein N878_27895 [Pseudomonas sp. EGD-AK9]|nr:hypothetical protein N878_27895 [Pseudomonas sp. EGD-AK9]